MDVEEESEEKVPVKAVAKVKKLTRRKKIIAKSKAKY